MHKNSFAVYISIDKVVKIVNLKVIDDSYSQQMTPHVGLKYVQRVKWSFTMWVDEEWLRNNQRINTIATRIAGRDVVGDVIITGNVDKYGYLRLLSKEEAEEVVNLTL